MFEQLKNDSFEGCSKDHLSYLSEEFVDKCNSEFCPHDRVEDLLVKYGINVTDNVVYKSLMCMCFVDDLVINDMVNILKNHVKASDMVEKGDIPHITQEELDSHHVNLDLINPQDLPIHDNVGNNFPAGDV